MIIDSHDSLQTCTKFYLKQQWAFTCFYCNLASPQITPLTFLIKIVGCSIFCPMIIYVNWFSRLGYIEGEWSNLGISNIR